MVNFRHAILNERSLNGAYKIITKDLSYREKLQKIDEFNLAYFSFPSK